MEIVRKLPLYERCRNREYVSTDIRLAPGCYYPDQDIHIEAIDGEYGLEMIYPKTAELVAVCGFDIQDRLIEIMHAPQGRPHEYLSRQARRFIMQRDFRLNMINAIKELSVEHNIQAIRGISAGNHYKILYSMSRERATELLDHTYLRAGFTDGADGNYYFYATR